MQYAGSWYSADPDELKKELLQFLANVGPDNANQRAGILTSAPHAITPPVQAVIVPHAGYAYSGQTAAYAYKCLKGQDVKRVFLLGPSHHVGIHGCALPMAVSFETPFGNLDVDREIVSELKDYPLFTKAPEVHRVEHSLEMQLPYIRQVLGEVKIVPIVVGQLSDEVEVRQLAEILKGYIGKGDVVVVSSDFTHFGPRYDYEPFKQNIKEGIQNLDRKAFGFISHLDTEGFINFQRETRDTICGFYPCAVLTALLPEDVKVSLLDYSTSQDFVPGDTENSVSYLAIAFSGKPWPEEPGKRVGGRELITFSAQEQKDLLRLARGTVDTYVREKRIPTAEELGVQPSKALKEKLGVFVTLNKYVPGERSAEHEKQLRGCIGYIWPSKPLYQAVIDNAVSACSRDYRFYSVQADELPQIRIEVSVLTPPRRIADYKEIVLGRDGIVLLKNGHQAVFLPFVPTEFHWNLSETLTQLSKKAGLQADDWQEGAKFDVFEALVFDEPATK